MKSFSPSGNRRTRGEKPAAKYSDSKFSPREEDAFSPAFTGETFLVSRFWFLVGHHEKLSADWLCPKDHHSGGEL
jgi:hypothetical protein